MTRAPTPDITRADFDFVRQIVHARSGLVLSGNKDYLLQSRLIPVVRNAGLGDIKEMIQIMRRSNNEPLCQAVTEAMMTKETFFFRDKVPFELFENHILPHMLETRTEKRHIRIWSAACSTGQEPYSLAILLQEMAPRLRNWKIDLIATDFSHEALAKAKKGLYSQFEVQRGLPIQQLVKYFDQLGEMWQLKQAVRALVRYRPLNLLHDFQSLGNFDVIFCRNVLIYLDMATRRTILERLARQMPPDGFLILGAAETMTGITQAFKRVPGQPGLHCVNPEHASRQSDQPAASQPLTAAG